MFAGFLPLLFNPHAWVALGLTVAVSFSGGFIKGWTYSQADQARAQVVALEEAIKTQQANSERDRLLAESQTLAAEERAHELEKIVAATDAASCRLSAADLDRLRKLAATR